MTLSFSARLSVSGSGVSLVASGSDSVTQVGAQSLGNVQIIGTTTEAINFGDVGTPGYLFVKNEDPTNFVRIGLATPVSSGDAFATLLPGEFAFIPTRQATVYAIADTGACNLRVLIAEL